jgi:hypothetical protein
MDKAEVRDKGVRKEHAAIGAVVTAVLLAALWLLSRNGVGVDSGTWTTCLYLCGSNLESRQSWGTKTLEELCKARIPKNVNAVIQVGGAKTWHTDRVAGNGERFVVENHELKNIGSVSDVSMGKASTLADFLAFCTREYPAGHTSCKRGNQETGRGHEEETGHRVDAQFGHGARSSVGVFAAKHKWRRR